MTTNDVFKYINDNRSQHFIPSNISDELTEALEVYYTNQLFYDKLFLTNIHRDRPIDDMYTSEQDLLSSMRHVVKMLEYPICNLYKTISQDYNPIENYDRYSTITLTKTGSESSQGGESSSNIRTGSVDNTKAGKETTTESGKETNTNSNAAYNASNFVNNDKSEMGFENRKTEFGFSEDRNDKTTYNSLKDTFSKENHSSTTFNNRKDETIEHTHGNIGTLTPYDMLSKERELSMFNYLEKVMELIINSVCEWGWAE